MVLFYGHCLKKVQFVQIYCVFHMSCKAGSSGRDGFGIFKSMCPPPDHPVPVTEPVSLGKPVSLAQTTPLEWPIHPAIERDEPRNLLLLALHQIVLRLGWIFKTESVIMPAFLDAVAGPGAGWLRGCMPVLNRLGQSVPPVFWAETLRQARLKKRMLSLLPILMSLPFAVLGTTWLAIHGGRRAWMPALFLAAYFFFFLFHGLYQLSFGTVQGKLVRPTRRGRLLRMSTFWGAFPAMGAAAWLLPGWLETPAPGFGYNFLLVAVCFFLSGLICLMLSEPRDAPSKRTSGESSSMADTLRVLRADANLRCLVVVTMLFGSGLIVFPHYQAFARERLGLAGTHLMVWVIVQNAAVGVYSLGVGPLADAWGNRLTLRLVVFASALGPAFVAGLPFWDQALVARFFWMVFLPLGFTAMVLRIVINYTLEICEPREHARYLSTVSLCTAVPFLFSPLVGWIVDRVGFEPVFLAAACSIFLAGLLTFRLKEPRHHLTEGEKAALGIGGEE